MRLKIKSFKKKPAIPTNYENDIWLKLQAAIGAIHSGRPIQNSREELYRAVEDLCIHKKAASLCRRLENELDGHIGRALQALVGRTPDTLAFLGIVGAAWEAHCSRMLTVRSVFLYLDRAYIIHNKKFSQPGASSRATAAAGSMLPPQRPAGATGVYAAQSLWDMAIRLFRRHLAASGREEVTKKTVRGILVLIGKERQGETIDRSLLKNLLRMMVSLGIYSHRFERPFLSATAAFYRDETARGMHQLEVPDYLQEVERRLLEETRRSMHYLDTSTRDALLTVVEKEMLTCYIGPLLDKGFAMLAGAHRVDDLHRMYILFRRPTAHKAGAHDAMCAALLEFTKKKGTGIIADTANEKAMVSLLLTFNDRINALLAEAFEGNAAFMKAQKDAW